MRLAIGPGSKLSDVAREIERVCLPTKPENPHALLPVLSTALPKAADHPGALVYVTDKATVAISNGVNWYPVTLGAHL